MDIIYAAERPSIANLIGDYVKQNVTPDEIEVTANPNETGSFYVGWQQERYVLSPSGQIESDRRMPSQRTAIGERLARR
ncbi:MAG: hypothetical protein OEQ25_12120 [Gammaproteobacteria bacterium]|nr:hypothetical protein [Gammaproteobacteria bacterium]MDH3507873.1 hypothetical protein [Gammaproteobacteria bacterium]